MFWTSVAVRTRVVRKLRGILKSGFIASKANGVMHTFLPRRTGIMHRLCSAL